MEQVLEVLKGLASNPTVISTATTVGLVVAGWALTIGWQVAAKWLRWKGQHDVDDAKGTADPADDAKAAQEQVILNALADAIDSHNPGSVIAKLIKVPGTLPPVVLAILKDLPTAVQAIQATAAPAAPVAPVAPPAPAAPAAPPAAVPPKP